MPKVVFRLRINVSPSNKHDALELIRFLSVPTRAKRGCLNSKAYQSIDDATALDIVEEWQSETELDDYIRSSEFKKVFVLMELSRREPEIQFQMVSQIQGMERIVDIRRDMILRP
ncbi:MAG: antibiotic biosynthesis monooxygenase [Desulfobacterales bacterium]